MGRAGGSSGGRSGGGGGSFSGGGRSSGGRSSFSSGRSGSSGSSGGWSGSSSSRSGSSSSGGLFGSSGGNRSSGGRSSSSSGRNSSSNSSSGGSSGGGFWGGGSSRPTNNRTTVIVNNSNRNYGNGRNYQSGGGYSRGSNPHPSGGAGCGKVLTMLIIAFLIFAVIFCIAIAVSGGSNNGVTSSTIVRQPLAAGSVNETAYYTDQAGWIGNETMLLKGLKNFYRATGVQPYLYITDNVNGERIYSDEVLENYAQALYPELFTDEAHLLLVFYEDEENHAYRYVCGKQAKSVIDREAGDILMDYIDKYYYADGMSDEEFFSRVFDETGQRIMTVEKSPWITVAYLLVILLIIAITAAILTQRSKQKLKKAEQDAKILETPLERFGDTDLKDLEKKYTKNNEEE